MLSFRGAFCFADAALDCRTSLLGVFFNLYFFLTPFFFLFLNEHESNIRLNYEQVRAFHYSLQKQLSVVVEKVDKQLNLRGW